MSEEMSNINEPSEIKENKRGRKKRKGNFHKLTLRISTENFEHLKINGDTEFSYNAQIEKIISKHFSKKMENKLIDESRLPALLTLKLKDLFEGIQKENNAMIYTFYDIFSSFIESINPERLHKFNESLAKKKYNFKE